MREEYVIDQEYKRTCPYCKQEFTADHLSRIYCPSKFDKKNYCKNRQKRIFDTLKRDGLQVSFTQKPPLKILIEDRREKSNNLDEHIRKLWIQRNISILDELTSHSIFKSCIPLTKLIEQAFDFEFYESTINKGSEGSEFHLGKYILISETKDTIKVNYKY